MTLSTSWQRMEDMAQASSIWLKLADDHDKAKLIFVGEPYPHEVSFVDGRYRLFNDALKAQGHTPSLRVAFNVALFGTREVKVLEQGRPFALDLARLRKKHVLEQWVFEVERHGAARDLKTTYSILPVLQLTQDQQAEYRSLAQHDLRQLYLRDGSRDGGLARGAEQQGQEVIDDGTAWVIETQVKALGAVAAERFLQKFGSLNIARRPMAQLEKARALMSVLASEFPASPPLPPPPLPKTDPFA